MLIPSDISGLEQAAESIRSGGLVAFPTDTFFALGADGMNPDAVENVFEVKGRNPGTPVPLLISDVEMVDALNTAFPDQLKRLADHFWPGALTVVLPASNDVPQVVTAGTNTVGLRVPDHDLARQLIQMSGVPITGTSCNLTGREPTKEAAVVQQVFGDLISICIDAECGESSAPSTVISYEAGRIEVLRKGAISIDSMRNIVGDIIVS